MHEVTLGGHADTIAGDVEMFRIKGMKEMRLQLNIKTCELISANSSHPNTTSLKNFVQMKPTNSYLLGTPLLPDNAMDNALEARCDDLDRAMSRLKLLSAHNALLLLLRACFSAPKIMHILRCSHCSDHIWLLRFDLSLCRGLCYHQSVDPVYQSGLEDWGLPCCYACIFRLYGFCC